MAGLPIIDISPLRGGSDHHDGAAAADKVATDQVAGRIDAACRSTGFFCITGHGLPADLLPRLDHAARTFFAMPDERKAAIEMARAGRAWRGWFPVGGELTSGRPDRKEGLYVGAEHGPDHPLVRRGTPLHGPNLFPADPPELGPLVGQWLEQMSVLAATVMRGIALGLGLEEGWFAEHLTAEPTILFRIFHYPPGEDDGWGVGEHTDYGLITLLAQDDRGGLQVQGPSGWIDVPPDPDVIVCNLGDMLDRLTGGRYRSTPHRVRNTSGLDRLSFPFFYDPSWDATVPTLPLSGSPAAAGRPRWDAADLHAWTGTYGEYLTAKVAKVFPHLFARN